MPQVKLHIADFNRAESSWRHYRTLETTDEKINEEIRKALEKGPTFGFYKYECFNSKNEKFDIYTINCNLFDIVS